MGKVKKAFGAFLVPLLSVLLAFLIGGIIMAALGANPFLAVKFLFQGAFGSKAGIGTTLTKATPLIFTALCACFAYKCGVFNLGGEGQFLMGSICRVPDLLFHRRPALPACCSRCWPARWPAASGA